MITIGDYLEKEKGITWKFDVWIDSYCVNESCFPKSFFVLLFLSWIYWFVYQLCIRVSTAYCISTLPLFVYPLLIVSLQFHYSCIYWLLSVLDSYYLYCSFIILFFFLMIPSPSFPPSLRFLFSRLFAPSRSTFFLRIMVP